MSLKGKSILAAVALMLLALGMVGCASSPLAPSNNVERSINGTFVVNEVSGDIPYLAQGETAPFSLVYRVSNGSVEGMLILRDMHGPVSGTVNSVQGNLVGWSGGFITCNLQPSVDCVLLTSGTIQKGVVK